MCMCLNLRVLSVTAYVRVHVLVCAVCVHVCVLSVYACACMCVHVCMGVIHVCMCVYECDMCACVCMGVICVYKHKEEQRSNEHTSGQELWLLLTWQYSVSLSSHWPRLMKFLNPQSSPWTKPLPSDSLQARPT